MAAGFLLILLVSAVASLPLEHPPVGSSTIPTAALGGSNGPDHKLGVHNNHTIGSIRNSTTNAGRNQTQAQIWRKLSFLCYSQDVNRTVGSITNSTTKADRNQTEVQSLPKLVFSCHTHGVNRTIGSSKNMTSNPNLNIQIFRAMRKRDVSFLNQLRVPAEEIEGGEGRQSKVDEKTPAKCRYYCFHPTGQFYCCEFAPTKSLKRGECPKIRPYCPQAFGRSALPERCVEDDFCPGPDKCCFDRCFNTHVCKTPVKVFDKP